MFVLNTNIGEQYQLYNRFIKEEHYIKPNGIHGIYHTRRVLILTLTLTDLLDFIKEEYKEILVYAAIYHDVGRDRNGRCYIHGYKSWKKVNKLNLMGNTNMTALNKEICGFIICNHCLDDKTAIKICKDQFGENIESILSLYYLFKDADALDRVRINHLNVNFLHYKKSKDLVELAHFLFNSNESDWW